MREIKFRAWEDEQMTTWGSIKQNQFMRDYFDNKNFPDEDCVLMQFTGLKDKNGVEIYEGDIVKILDPEGVYDPFIATVSYLGSEFLIYRYQDIGGFFENLNNINNNRDVFVVGNTYENPKLLKESASA